MSQDTQFAVYERKFKYSITPLSSYKRSHLNIGIVRDWVYKYAYISQIVQIAAFSLSVYILQTFMPLQSSEVWIKEKSFA